MIGSSFSTAKVEGWFDVINQSSETVPPFGVVKVTGIDVQTTERNEQLFAFKVNKPDSGDANLIAFNSPIPIPADAYGRCSSGRYALARYVDDGGVLATGDLLGVVEDDWRLDTGGGYQFLGKVSADGDPLVGVFERVFSPVTHLWGRAAANVTETTQEFSINNIQVLGGSWSGDTASGVKNTFGWTITAGDSVFVLVATNGDLHAYQAECP